jgi:hypothetical protein
MPATPELPELPNNKGQFGSPSSNGAKGALEGFRKLPQALQLAIIGGVVVLLFLIFSGSRGERVERQTPVAAQEETLSPPTTNGGDALQALDPNRQALTQKWIEQTQQALSEQRESIEARFEELKTNVETELDRRFRVFNTEITGRLDEQAKFIQDENRRSQQLLEQLIDQNKQMQMQAPVRGDGVLPPSGGRKERISQTPLSASDLNVDGRQALLNPLVSRLRGNNEPRTGSEVEAGSAKDEPEREKLPFIPPLGFIRATLLNGVDALVGGATTPALVRMHGVYKTARNSSVNLDGCFALVEFEGDISTERALGKPSRMTCVYPDQGAVTYDVAGYVVDAEDGIIGIPGVFYEGDATRMAAAIAAEFAAGIGEVIKENQSTSTVNADGVERRTITGDQTKAEIAEGSSRAMESLRDYLFDRVSRVLPFIRIDTTRDVHLVLLSGTELRTEGKPWTLLFDGTDR